MLDENNHVDASKSKSRRRRGALLRNSSWEAVELTKTVHSATQPSTCHSTDSRLAFLEWLLQELHWAFIGQWSYSQGGGHGQEHDEHLENEADSLATAYARTRQDHVVLDELRAKAPSQPSRSGVDRSDRPVEDVVKMPTVADMSADNATGTHQKPESCPTSSPPLRGARAELAHTLLAAQPDRFLAHDEGGVLTNLFLALPAGRLCP